MKLLTKTSLLLLTITIFIFFIGNIIFFQVTKRMINSQVETELASIMHKVVEKIRENPDEDYYSDLVGIVSIKKVEESMNIRPMYRDTMLLDNFMKKYVPYKSLILTIKYEKNNFQVEIYKSLLESNTLIERITISSLGIILAFIFSIFVMNRFIFARTWRNFLNTLKSIENYDIKKLDELELEDSEILEFDQLNKVLVSLANRIRNDYINLKELTANTSHEIQTPLAIIKNKAEILIQSENLEEDQLNQIGTIIESTERLSKLNQSLLLIAKIENNQYKESEKVKLDVVLNRIIENFKVFSDVASYQINVSSEDLEVEIHPVLLDVLLGNLLKNAYTYCSVDGKIEITLKETKLEIKNSGEDLGSNANNIFDRFVKLSDKRSSTGLGLAIVKKIVDYYSLDIKYLYENKMHIFNVDFQSIKL